ncbi:hypothetical protein NIES208_15890 [[Limnothrix rosea] IAM M-220]|nr:hypothetical protein NIES208_15890 [[Limnothrix rosea] IAM M-220]
MATSFFCGVFTAAMMKFCIFRRFVMFLYQKNCGVHTAAIAPPLIPSQNPLDFELTQNRQSFSS